MQLEHASMLHVRAFLEGASLQLARACAAATHAVRPAALPVCVVRGELVTYMLSDVKGGGGAGERSREPFHLSGTHRLSTRARGYFMVSQLTRSPLVVSVVRRKGKRPNVTITKGKQTPGSGRTGHR